MNVALLLLLLGRLAFGAPAAVRQSPLPLGEIKVTGTKRFTPADLAKVSRLAIGLPATGTDFRAAATRVDASGLFKQFKYSYVAQNGKWVLTFEIEDYDWNIPVFFDNFIWFGDDEISAAVRGGVPSFDGNAPNSPRVTASITTALQQLLTTRSIPGRIDFLPEGDLKSLKGYLFRVVNPSPMVCAWSFPGASKISPKNLEAELTASGREYSKSFVMRRSKSTVLARYRRLGYWRARIDEPVAALTTGEACSGATVTMAISEGDRYKFAGARWSGHTALSSGELNRALWLKPGEETDDFALDEGLQRVLEAYAIKGYVTARATPTEQLDDATHKVTFNITVVEGPRFTMGTVEFAGAAPAIAAELAKRWRLKQGDAFDASYPGKFQREEILPRLVRGARAPSLRMQTDPQVNTVNVRFTFSQ